jgi:hypothetical protein
MVGMKGKSGRHKNDCICVRCSEKKARKLNIKDECSAAATEEKMPGLPEEKEKSELPEA